MKNKLVLLLVEGVTEEIVYLNLLKKLYNMEEIDCEKLPETARTLIEPLPRRTTRCLYLKTEYLDRYVILLNCGGYEYIKKLLKLILKRHELSTALRKSEVVIAIAADRDKNPFKDIETALSSLNIEFRPQQHNILEISIGYEQQTKLRIHVIEQGMQTNNKVTGEIEDELESMLEEVIGYLATEKNLVNAIRKTESLTTKQRFLLYLALLDHQIKIRKLFDKLNEVLNRADKDMLAKKLGSLVEKLEKAIN